MNALKRNREKISRNNTMSSTTKDFIQKICYRKTASIDMTRYGFINDSKLQPVNLLLKPLIAQLEKICAKPSKHASLQRNSPIRKKVKINLRQPTSAIHSPSSPGSPSGSPTSALSSPGTRSPRPRDKKVRIQTQPSTTEKKVRMILPQVRAKKKIHCM